VGLNRSCLANTQPIWKRQYPTGAWESQTYYNFFYFAFLIDIIVILQLLCKNAYMHFRKYLTQFYINFSRQEHPIDVIKLLLNSWDSKYTLFLFSFTVLLNERFWKLWMKLQVYISHKYLFLSFLPLQLFSSFL